GDQLHDFDRRGTLALEKAAAAWAERDRAEKDQDLNVTPSELRKIIAALGDNQSLIQEQRQLIIEQQRQLRGVNW
ncbi:hypothetical protein A2U01_0102583, partial [Trifolium medium]|nr:hypothetical protein [Trifolium medium]